MHDALRMAQLPTQRGTKSASKHEICLHNLMILHFIFFLFAL
ncbi:hypothetical protein [Rubritalea tangerina]